MEIDESADRTWADYEIYARMGFVPSDWYDANSVEDATRAFCYMFERPQNPEASMPTRVAKAQEYYDRYAGIPLSELGGGDIFSICQEITQMYLDRGTTYGPQTEGNIRQTYESDTHIVCTTYVSVALYVSGLVDEEIINTASGGNYHWTVSFPLIMRAAGWTEVDKSDLQPGDVLNKPGSNEEGGHTVIYVGDGLIYDQTSCTISDKVPNPNGQPKDVSSYIADPAYIAWGLR